MIYTYLKRIGIIICILLIVIEPVKIFSQNDMLQDWRIFSESKNSGKLIAWLKGEAYRALYPSYVSKKNIDFTLPDFFGKLGIFITIVKDGKARGCFGAFNHASVDIKDVLKDYLYGALRRDPRYTPISIEELADVKIILSITSQPFLVADINAIDISLYGVMAQSDDGETVIFVPSEIKTHSYLMKKLKDKNISSFFVFKTVTIQ